MEKSIKLHNNEEANLLFGRHDENLKLIKKNLSIQISIRGNLLLIKGVKNKVSTTANIINNILNIIRSEGNIAKQDIEWMIKRSKEESLKNKDNFSSRINVMSKRQFILPKTKGQNKYIKLINDSEITFAIGPAGTGKTFLAIAMAVSALKDRQVSRIILTRPAVESGESLGFLPGDLMEKIDPYLRPIYDALYEFIEQDKVQNLLQKKVIEVVPLAYMRGRTLNDSFIVLDEAQNSTPEQMKMFLTRFGFNSKAVVTGDITQIDLPHRNRSGLVKVQKILKNIQGISFIYLDDKDVVRNNIVREIINAYEKFDIQTK